MVRVVVFDTIGKELEPEHAEQEMRRKEEGRVKDSYAVLVEGMLRVWLN